MNVPSRGIDLPSERVLSSRRLYPELRKFEPPDRDAALRKAKDAKSDGFELMAIALAVELTVALTKYSNGGPALIERIGAALANLLIAIPILMVLAGPLYVRRVRRAIPRNRH